MITTDFFSEDFALTEAPRPEPESTPDPRTAPDMATKTRAAIIFQDMQRAFKRQQPHVTLEWPGQGQVTLTRNQIFSVLREIIGKSMQVQNRWIPILGDRTEFLNKLSSIKIYRAPIVRLSPEPGQQKLDLDEEKKKESSNDYRDVAVQRAMRKARAEFPAATSDTEAFAKSMMVAQDQDQANFDRLRSGLGRQRELLKKNDQLDITQDQIIDALNKEIQDVENHNTSLERTVQQMQRANAELQQTLTRMRGQKVTPPNQAGVSVATDKIAMPVAEPVSVAEPEPASMPIDIGARQKAQAIAQELEKLKSQQAMWQQLGRQEPQGQDKIEDIQQQIKKLKQQLAKLQSTDVDQRQQVIKLEPAKDQDDEGDLGAFGQIDQETADLFKNLGVKNLQPAAADNIAPAPKTKKKTKELSEDSIPTKQVFQGYTVTFDRATGTVTISQRGQVLKQFKLKMPTRRGYEQLVNKFIHDQEDEKYPDDIEDRDVSLPMRKVAESGPETWTIHFTDGTTTRVRIPSDEVSPDYVKAYYAKKGKQVSKIDYGYGAETEIRSEPEAHEPGSGTAVSGRTGERLPEDMKSDLKAMALAKIRQALADPKLDPESRRDFETRLKKIQALEETGNSFNRGGYNKLRDKNDYYDKREHLAKQLDTPGYSYADRQSIRDRMMQLEKAARMQGLI